MINLILFFFQLLIKNSLNYLNESNFTNMSYIDDFLDNLSNFSLDLPFPEKSLKNIENKNYCIKYNRTLSICLQCESGYTLLNGECVCFDRNCKRCQSSLYGACTECQPGYALSIDNTCRCNIPHCLLCDDDICNVCEKGYSLSESNTSCEFNLLYKTNGFCNDTNCDICTNILNGSCIKCKDGFNLENGTCIRNPSLGNYFKGNILCPTNYISAGKGCNKFCLGAYCDNNNPFYMTCENKCLYCKHGVLFENINCNMNEFCFDEKCTKCRTDEIGMCDRCEIGYRLLFGRCEEKCDDVNCLNCDYTYDGSCNWCKNGYALIDGKCFIKKEGYSNDELYQLYEEGIKEIAEEYNISYLGKGSFEFFYDNTSFLLEYSKLIDSFHFDKFKELCKIENCNACLLNNSEYCVTCLNTYTPVNGRCIKCNISKCSLCLEENICNRCEGKYVLINNQCINNYGTIPFCLKYSNNLCSQCEDNYILKDGFCNLDNIYSQNTSYEKLSCSDDSVRNEICIENYYFKNNNCTACYDPKCFFCYDEIGCIICEKGYNLIDGRCLKKAEFNETVENCVSYDYDGKCIGCDTFCVLKEEKCNCKIISNIIIYLLIGVMAIIIATIILIIFKQRLSVRKIEKISEYNMKLIEENKISEQEMELLQENDKKLKKCVYCKNEIALYKLSCGCIFCKDDFRDIFEGLNNSDIMNNSINITNSKNNNNNKINYINNGNIAFKKNREKNKFSDKFTNDNLLNSSSMSKIKKGKCPCCHLDFDDYKQITYQCDICFDITSKIFHFKCGCALSVCKICFNKIIVTKKCPGCRKNILDIK